MAGPWWLFLLTGIAWLIIGWIALRFNPASIATVGVLLGIPEHISTACHIVAGYPARPFPRRLHRPEVSQLAFADRYGDELCRPGPLGHPVP